MSKFANKYNKGSKFTFKPDSKNFEYYNLQELFDTNGKNKVYTIKALYINTKGYYGDAPVVATSEYFVNLPSHLLDTVNEMLRDDELIDAINNEEFGFTIEPYTKGSRILYSVRWVDIEE